MFWLGMFIVAACALRVMHYDKDDQVNAIMLFIMDNSLQAFIRLVTVWNFGRLIVLWAVCHSLTTWVGIT